MTLHRTPAYRSDRVHGVFLRSIGSLCVAAYELRAVRAEPERLSNPAWDDFGTHLLESVEAILEGAATSTFAGNTIAILRDGVRVAVDSAHVDKLTEKVARHTLVGRMLGMPEPAVSGSLTLTA